MSILTDFWKRIDGPVHPDDRPVFEKWASAHEGRVPFDLNFPPPAFWGDVEKAPVFILENNGGFKPGETEQEYLDALQVDRHITYLKTAGPVRAGDFSPYYGRNWLHDHVANGQVAWINAVAYRSPNAKVPAVGQLSNLLPSAKIARQWLREELLPRALRGECLVVFHRWSLWKVDKKEMHSECIRFSTNSVSENVSREMLAAINGFIEGKKT